MEDSMHHIPLGGSDSIGFTPPLPPEWKYLAPLSQPVQAPLDLSKAVAALEEIKDLLKVVAVGANRSRYSDQPQPDPNLKRIADYLEHVEVNVNIGNSYTPETLKVDVVEVTVPPFEIPPPPAAQVVMDVRHRSMSALFVVMVSLQTAVLLYLAVLLASH